MPEIRYYTVTQEREVRVWANNSTDAVLIANATFKAEPAPNVPGSVVHHDRPSAVRERDIHAREDY